MYRYLRVISAFICAVFLFSACANKNSETITGKEFQLLNAPNNAEITISFFKDEPRFAGKSAVNRYFGNYKIDDNEITFSQIGSTMMMGPEELMIAESEYLNFLNTVKSYKIENKKLYLIGEKTLEFKQISTSEE